MFPSSTTAKELPSSSSCQEQKYFLNNHRASVPATVSFKVGMETAGHFLTKFNLNKIIEDFDQNLRF